MLLSTFTLIFTCRFWLYSSSWISSLWFSCLCLLNAAIQAWAETPDLVADWELHWEIGVVEQRWKPCGTHASINRFSYSVISLCWQDHSFSSDASSAITWCKVLNTTFSSPKPNYPRLIIQITSASAAIYFLNSNAGLTKNKPRTTKGCEVAQQEPAW